MATSYTGLRVQDTYNAIIKIGDNSNLSGTAKLLSDGLGNDSPLYLSGTRLGIGISPAYQFHTSGNAKIGGNLIISGNLTVNGTLTYLNVEDLAVEDPLIKLAKDNTANTLDIGFFGKYVATGTKYKGLFNDASDDKFKLFIGTETEPTTTVDTTASGYSIGTLVANLEGNVTGNLIGNVTGNLTGNVTGNVTGNLSGNVTGGTISGTTGTFSDDVSIAVSKKLKFGGGNHTYINEDIDDRLRFFVGGSEFMRFTEDTADTINFYKTATFSGLVSGIAPTADLNFATKKYVDDNIPTVTTPALSAVLTVGNTSGSNNLIIQDNDELILGSGTDFRAYHNETNTLFRINTGDLIFNSFVDNGDIKFQLDNGADPSGVTEYMRLDGGDQRIFVSKLMRLGDDIQLRLGDNNDIRLYHNSTSGNNNIENHTGSLYITNYADDEDIVFRSDNGSGDVVEYFRLDGSTNTIPFGRSPHLSDNLKLYFGSDTANDANIKWDSSASQLFIGGQIKFLDDIYVLGKTNLNDADIDDTLAFYVSSTDDARQRADARDDDTNYARLHWFGKSDDGSTSNFRHAYYDGAAYINVTAQNNILTYTGALKVAPASGDGILFLQSTSQALRIDQNSLRTTTNTQFTFMTNSTSALQLDTSQNAIFYANLYMPQYLKHSGDENTYLQFQTDRQTLVAGGTEFIDFANTTQDYITIGGVSDIDIKLVSSTNNKYIFIQGSDGKIGINDQTPSYAFDVNAETRFGSAVNFDNTRYNKGGSSTFWYATTTGARINMDARVDGTGVVIHKWNRNADDDAYLSYAENWYDGNSYHKISAYNNGFMLNGNIRFESYGAGNITGTLSRLVGFEANGGLIDVPLTTFIDGSGVAGRIPYFTDASSLTSSSLFFENSDKIRHLQTIGPNDDVRKGFCVEDQTSMAANVGGQLTFRYMYTTSGSMTEGAMIRMYKLNATDGDYSSGLKFQVRNTGDDLSTKMTLNPSGFLGLGTTDPQQPLHIQSTGDLFTRYQANSNANGVQFQTWHGNSQTMTINSNTTNPFAVYVGSASGTIAINVDSNAKVGIGVTSGFTSLLNFAANQNAADPGADNWSGSAINTFGGDLATGRVFFQGYQQTGNDTIGINVESASNRAVLYNYTDQRYLQIWDDDGDIEMPSGSLGIGVSPDGGNGGLLVTKTNGTFANANQKRVASFYDGSVNSERPGIILGYDDSSTPHGIVAARTQSGSGTIPGIQFFTYNGGWGPRMTILANGRVGIGTNVPTAKLQLESTTGGSPTVAAFLVNSSTTVGTETRLAFAAHTNSDIATGRYSYISTINTTGSNGQAMRFATNETGSSAAERMRITKEGYVLINRTSNATNQVLQVNGFIDITNVDSSALRFYNGSTFRGGFGLSKWATAIANSDMVCYAVNHLDIVTNGTSTANFRFRDDSSFTLNFGTHAFVPGYSGIGINVPSGTKKYLGFYDSGTTTYGGGMWYDEASNITSLYSLLNGTQTQHVQLDRATGNTWINPSGGKVTIGIGSTQSEMLHIRSTSGDADIMLHSSNGQKLRLDSNSIRTTTASNLAIFVNNDTAKGIYLDSGGQVRVGTTSAAPNFIPGPPKLYVVGNQAVQSPIGPNDSIRTGLAHYDSTAGWGAGIGGQIVLGYIYTSSAYTEGAIIKMYKTNSTQGDYSSGLKFQVRNNGEDLSSKMTLTAGGNLSVVGSMTAASDVIAFSDKRVKENIITINNALNKVSKLRGVSYNRTDIDDKSNKIGVIAQEVKEVLPEVVNYNKDDDKYGVDYGKMAGVFIEAIKELKAEVDSLKQEIKKLKK